MLSDSVDGTACIDVREFYRLMCPEKYRLPEMGGEDRKALGKILLADAVCKRQDFEQTAKSFRTKSSSHATVVQPTPPSAMPEVLDETWSRWNQFFDRLDSDADDVVQLTDLESSGLVSKQVCRYIVMAIDADNGSGFTRKGFLTALLESHKYRRTGFVTMHVSL